MKRVLIVAVPGLTSGLAPWRRIAQEIEKRSLYPDCQVQWHFHDSGVGVFSRVGLEEVSRNLGANLVALWEMNHGYDEIVLVGHSLGALVVRRAWLNAIDPMQGSDYTAADWATKVVRFVLFAGVSRGVDMEKPWYRKVIGRLIEWVPGRFTSEDCFRGSSFITDLRVAWIRYFENLPPQARPHIVHVLGTRDTIVRREDTLDVDVFRDPETIDISNATHDDLHRIDGVDNQPVRIALILKAFTQERIRPAPLPGTRNSPRVLMVVHGIRASNTDEWIADVKSIVAQHWNDVVVVTPTYGFLSALRFTLPSVRRRYARFFRDFYTEVISSHRTPQVSVLCHSNGTYAFARCANEFRAFKFERVALAGSVLPPGFEWSGLIGTQVKAVRNDCASRDYPVALLCSALRALGMRDIGTGGFDGFRGGRVKEVRYHDGGHGAMLRKMNLESILRFLLEGNETSPTLRPDADWTRRLSRLMPYLTIIVLVGGTILGLATWGWPFAVGAAITIAVLVIFLDVI